MKKSLKWVLVAIAVILLWRYDKETYEIIKSIVYDVYEIVADVYSKFHK